MHKTIAPGDLAQFLMDKVEKEAILPELFGLIGFDCLARRHVDPDRLDGLMQAFEQSGETETLAQIIALMQEGRHSADAQETALVEEMQRYIQAHLSEDGLLEELARALHISYFYASHLFRFRTGMTLSAYRSQKRLEKAAHALLETEASISAIAADCGFNNISYFTERFTGAMGLSPSAFRARHAGLCLHPFYDWDDMRLAAQMESVRFLPDSAQEVSADGVRVRFVHEPDDTFGFLHEAAIIEYQGVLYASWYNCLQKELQGYTPICGRRSRDGGKTWTALEVLADDPDGRILYCPPVYGICDGRLYMLVNEMVAPDHMHALNLYVLDNATGTFVRLWSRPIPFKLNTNVVRLPNGKLLLPGRVAELDGFPNTPAVLISDSGKIDAEWRLVKIAPNGALPDGKQLVHPELTAAVCADVICMFCRNDQRRVPLVYLSRDFGETWSAACAHDIPYISSKIYAGTLTNGRNYLVANTHRGNRSRLVLYLSAPGSMRLEKQLVLFDTQTGALPGVTACHYPAAAEADGQLHILATYNQEWSRRGAVLFSVSLGCFG